MATVYVKRKENETPESALERALRQFKKKVEKENIIKESIARQHFISNTEKRIRRNKAAKRKYLKERYAQIQNY